MVGKRGRPPGTYTHPDKLFTEFVTEEAKTPDRIRNEINARYDVCVSWNTVIKRLDRLVVEGLVFKRDLGNYHFYQSEKF